MLGSELFEDSNTEEILVMSPASKSIIVGKV